MHALWLIELTAAMALQGPIWTKKPVPFPQRMVKDYWSFSRQRINQWHEQLHQIKEHLDRPGAIRRAALWGEAQPVIEEVLLSEMLTRYLASLASHLEKTNVDFDGHPIARNIFQSHCEVRHRCLHLMVYAPGLPVELSVHLNRLRFLMERWIDQILGYLPPEVGSEQYGFCAESIEETRNCRSGAENEVSKRLWWSLLLAGLRGNISGQLDRRPNSPRLNALIAQQVLGMFSPEHFDDLGIMKSVRRQAIEATVVDSDGRSEHDSLDLQSPLNTLLSKKRNIYWVNRLM